MGNGLPFFFAHALIVSVVGIGAIPAQAQIDYGPEIMVRAGSVDIAVPGYSVPSVIDFDNDGRQDLIVGEGSGSYPGKVRLYLNNGTPSDPQFSSFTYLQSNGSDLVCIGSGCMGCFPRVAQWDGDGKKDLLVGQANGTVRLYLNINTDADPLFDAGQFLQVGLPGAKVNINVGARATLCVVDWNNDARKDLVVGGYDGRVRLFINEGTDTEPDFRNETFAQDNGGDLVVPGSRASPVVADINNDSMKDVLAGNTNGELLFYANVMTNAAPAFAGYEFVRSEGVKIDLPGTPRARPFLCDWNQDGHKDLLVGAGDGKVHLYLGLPGQPCADFDGDGHVDPDDTTRFQMCQTGAGVPLEDPSCEGADLDDDGDIDQSDFGLMQRCFGSAQDPPNPECQCD